MGLTIGEYVQHDKNNYQKHNNNYRFRLFSQDNPGELAPQNDHLPLLDFCGSLMELSCSRLSQYDH